MSPNFIIKHSGRLTKFSVLVVYTVRNNCHYRKCVGGHCKPFLFTKPQITIKLAWGNTKRKEKK